MVSHSPATHSLHTINNPSQFVLATIDEFRSPSPRYEGSPPPLPLGPFKPCAKVFEIQTCVRRGNTSRAFEILSDIGVDFIRAAILSNDGGAITMDILSISIAANIGVWGRCAEFEIREVPEFV